MNCRHMLGEKMVTPTLAILMKKANDLLRPNKDHDKICQTDPVEA